MSDEHGDTDPVIHASDDSPWQQRALDNIWFLLALGIVVPLLMYLGWGLWELAELPTWGGR